MTLQLHSFCSPSFFQHFFVHFYTTVGGPTRRKMISEWDSGFFYSSLHSEVSPTSFLSAAFVASLLTCILSFALLAEISWTALRELWRSAAYILLVEETGATLKMLFPDFPIGQSAPMLAYVSVFGGTRRRLLLPPPSVYSGL